MYSKQTETAIASASRLAEVYDGGITRLSATNIADSRGLQRPFVAKILTMLSQAGLVSGAPGPGGGYTLTRPPKKIRLYDIYRLFEREDNSDACPFGGGVCGVGEPCPLHNKLVEVQDATDRLLHETTLEAFRVAYQEDGLRPVAKGEHPSGKRQTFRAASNQR
ncbi:MAG: Rrf2 family transcriptional regulator [Planctomycetes bacterium]|jgi:Rrf2 family protein|nr:Rrf2 family transcriptional regulator [Planctomycetota bacterium]MCP4839980.1 Rrf2 family transcriptional regulator [Planctomycetota bacterium]